MEATKEEFNLLKDFDCAGTSSTYLDYEQYTEDLSVPNYDYKIGMTIRATKNLEEDYWYGAVLINDEMGFELFEKEIPRGDLDAVLCKLKEYKQKFENREWKFVNHGPCDVGYVEMND